MKATAILSALVFAHAAFAQATDSTSVAVSTSAAGSSSTAAAATTTAATTTVAQSSAPTTTSLSETKSRSKSKSNSAGTSTSEGATPSPTGASAPSGNQVSSGETPLIPTDISTGCSTFLKSLNADTQLSACFTPLLNAVSAYGPSSGSTSGLSKALGNLCGSNACSQSTISAKLTQFKDSCANELTGDNPSQLVTQNYDVLYSVIPFKNAVCAKGDSQTYCLLDTSAGNSTSDSVTYATSHLANSVSRQGAQTVLVPNTDTYLHSNIMYLFSSPSMNAGELCTTCTQQVLAKYFAFQSAVPHALGLKKSLLLGGQNEFFAAIKEKCPSNFVVGISEIANVETPTDINRSGALPAYTGSILTAVAGALVAVVALV